MTETKLPQELEEQAILHALGVLDPEDEQVFMVRLKGESDLLRETTRAYQATIAALAGVVAPVMPQATLRERLLDRIVGEEARETEQFERTADALALGSVPVKPRDSVRERLLSRIMADTDIQLHAKDSASIADKSTVSQREEPARGSEIQLPLDAGFLVTWLHSCRTAVSNFLRTLLIRSAAPRPSAEGLTFVMASEGTWRDVAPGVVAKLLSYDGISCRTTALVRIAPGTNYAPHRHAAAEELYVLEGGCFCGGRELAAGDYHRAEAGTEHHNTSTDDGCLLLVISSPQNEMLR